MLTYKEKIGGYDVKNTYESRKPQDRNSASKGSWHTITKIVHSHRPVPTHLDRYLRVRAKTQALQTVKRKEKKKPPQKCGVGGRTFTDRSLACSFLMLV